jgi:voltage-gated sodium channel
MSMNGWWSPSSQIHGASVALHKARAVFAEMAETKGWIKPHYEAFIAGAAQHKSMKEMDRLQKFVSSSSFDVLCSIMILCNSFILGYQVQYQAKHMCEPPSWLRTLQTASTMWFVFEVLLRMVAYRMNYFMSKDWQWNMFDLIAVASAFLERLLQYSAVGSPNFAAVRVIRIMRLVRVVKCVRAMKFFSELRMMVFSSLKSVKPFFWALCLLSIVLFVFAIIVTQAVTAYRMNNPEMDHTALVEYFGTLYRSVITLFQSVSGGVSWRDVSEALVELHWTFAIWMSIYVAFTVFAILNIVTGIFVNGAMQSAHEDQDVSIAEAMNNEGAFAQEALRVFQEADANKTGYITLQDLEEHMKDSRVRAYLHHLGLDFTEARGLFQLLDIGDTGRVYAKEFVLGCQQLRGSARNLDVATLLYQNKRMMSLWSFFMSFVEDQFAELNSRVMTRHFSDAGNITSEDDILLEDIELHDAEAASGKITL